MPSKDFSGRITPEALFQYRYYLGRVGKQRLRVAEIQAMDYLILILVGACLGTLAKVSDESFGVLGYTYSVISVCKFSCFTILNIVSHISALIFFHHFIFLLVCSTAMQIFSFEIIYFGQTRILERVWQE
ncbi:hypothetical protein SAY86_016876 [Trapa natans]|uniref:ABC transporter family G domain-containing protein n=1 Tax=Trapa natans TaxID=22666 RepID=A0AAN7R4L7_TRANT|nr:hypothetical protein SAY86_016876 [Trapa natans]